MVNEYIFCELCYKFGGSNIIPLSNEKVLEETKTHMEIHERQLFLCVGAKVNLKVEKIETKAVRKPATPGRRGRPPGLKQKTGNQESTPKPKQERTPRPPPPQPPPPPDYTDRVDKHCFELLKASREGKSVKCGQCGGYLTVVHRGDQIEVRYAIQHVFKHLGSQIFSCNQCDFRATTESVIRKHLSTEHSLGGSKENFKISSANSEGEVIAKLTECYGKRNS